MGSVGRLPAGMSEERRGCPPAPLHSDGFHGTGPSTYRSALLKARCQNGSSNKINITAEKLPEYVSVSIIGKGYFISKNNFKKQLDGLCTNHVAGTVLSTLGIYLILTSGLALCPQYR